MKTNEKAKITRCFTPLAYEFVAFLCQAVICGGEWAIYQIAGGDECRRQT